MKCSKCGKEFEEYKLIKARINDVEEILCVNCVEEESNNDNKWTSFGFSKDLGYGTGKETRDTTFYFSVPEKYFANANRLKMTYSTEKEITDIELWNKMTKVELVSQALGFFDDDSYKRTLDLLLAEDELACEIYDGIELITKEQYEEI